MNANNFSNLLAQETLESTQVFYRDMVSNLSLAEAKDPFWHSFIELMRSLPEPQQELIFAFARQASVDSISTTLAGIDGITSLGGRYFNLALVDQQGNNLAGGLQEEFLAIAESPRSNKSMQPTPYRGG